MPYSVSNTDSSLNFTVQDGAVDTSTLSVALVGTNAENYGDDIARNDIHLLENFASISAPTAGTVLTGQLWYDKTDNVLRVYKGTDINDWVNLETTISASAPTRLTARSGEEYFNSANNKGYVFDGANWKPTGYAGEVTSDYSADSLVNNPTKFGSKIRAIFLKDTSGRAHPCLALVYVNNSTTNELYGTGTNGETLMALFNHDDQFTVDNVTSETEGDNINYYAELNATGGIGVTLSKGMNLRSDYIAEAVALATEAVTAQKANALITTGNAIITADNLIHVGRSYIPTANITETLGDLTHLFDQTHTQNLYVGGSSAGEIRFGGNNIVSIGNTSTQANVIYTQDLFVGDDLVVTDDMAVTGNTNLTGNTDITNNLQVNKNITGNATITGVTVTDGTLQINSGSITQGVNGTFSGTVQFGTLSDGTIGITAWADEDTMSSNSATLVPTQQSVKAYVDTANANMKTYVDIQDNAQDLDITTDSGNIDILVNSEILTIAGGDGIGSVGSGTTVTMAVDSSVARTDVDETFDANVIITGNLTVNGSQTSLNTATLDVEDLNITVGSGATTSSATNGAGLTFGTWSSGTIPTLTWDHANSRFAMNYSLATTLVGNVTGNLTGDVAGDVTGTVSSLANHTTTNLTQGTNLYYTTARANSAIQSQLLSALSDVSYTSPTNEDTLSWVSANNRWEAVPPVAGVTTLVALTDVDAGGSTTGQVLQKAANGNFTFGSVSTANYYVDGLTFDTGTGVLTASVNGTTNQTVDLDGRYSTTDTQYAVASSGTAGLVKIGYSENGKNYPVELNSDQMFVNVPWTDNNTTYSTASSSTAGLVKIGYSENGKNYPVELSADKMFVNVPWTDNNTTYSAGGGLSLNSTTFSHADTSGVSNLAASGRRYVTGLTFDIYGHVTGYTYGTEVDQSFNDTNYYLNNLTFSGGTLTASMTGAPNISVSLDGRYLTSITSSQVTTALGYTPPSSCNLRCHGGPGRSWSLRRYQSAGRQATPGKYSQSGIGNSNGPTRLRSF